MYFSSLTRFKSHSRAPIESLPIDVLREIFTLCLPRIPLDDAFQPNLHEAPMLLCHICSFWRMVALATPTLWNRLAYCFTVHETAPQFGSWAFLEDQVEFVQRWQANHESIAPFLTFSSDIVYRAYEQETFQERVPAEDVVDFLLDYFMTAQYLDLDQFFWNRVLKQIEEDEDYDYCFPNLHTVIERLSRGEFTLPFLVPTSYNSPSHVRRLHVTETTLSLDEDVEIPLDWTSLTYISFEGVAMTSDFILSFLNAVPNLQCGYFNIREWTEPDDYEPVKCTLSYLHTLCMSLSDNTYIEDFSLSSLFHHLYLPALHTLHLSSSSDS
ncbi:hypothetical protein BDN70DRAFT_931582 [Pholiota conissans]|uniref:F-box domain-containing protein n=1 Tax=Pholiota conissans TaxID=109636 RepID=A0A9P5Z354_9AGAR|nr:hypothetical protein BDN70DRAFT_931582 [Pholiota conissans]